MWDLSKVWHMAVALVVILAALSVAVTDDYLAALSVAVTDDYLVA